MNTEETVPATAYEMASYVIAGIGLLLVLGLHLLPAFLAGFLVYELVHTLAPLLRATRLANVRAKLGAVALLATLVVALQGSASGVWSPSYTAGPAAFRHCSRRWQRSSTARVRLCPRGCPSICPTGWKRYRAASRPGCVPMPTSYSSSEGRPAARELMSWSAWFLALLFPCRK